VLYNFAKFQAEQQTADSAPFSAPALSFWPVIIGTTALAFFLGSARLATPWTR
jgi:hypothetical protein